MSRKFSWVLSLMVVLTLALAACGGAAQPAAAPPAEEPAAEATEEPTAEETDTEATAEPTEEGDAEATAEPTEEGDVEATAEPEEEAATGSDVPLTEALSAVDAESPLGRALAGELEGTTVSIFGPFTDEDAVKFDNSVAAFEEATGIDIQYEGSKEFETTISVRVDAGDPPDIADFPQPGLLQNLVGSGAVVDVSTFIPAESIAANYNQSWLDMAMMEGPDGPMMAGVWHRFNGKSLVWYPKDDFDAAGYEIPTTWDELMKLTETIASDGDPAWCIGIESGTATGWPATDWIEDIMLRTTSLENYDAWTRGELAFDSPEVTNAAELMSEIWLNEEYVYGGTAAIVSTSFGDSVTPMFTDPPGCWLHRQGNFITTFFPEGTEAGVDYDFFYLPPIDAEYGSPFLVAGDIMAMFNDRPEVQAVMQFFTYGESVKGWLAAGGALSPHMDASLDWYGDDVERGVAELTQQSTSVRFDGSDLMPGEVGAGSFWKGMTDYLAGTVDLPTALAEIDAAWPR
jgi:alpha-glucoside transport system substrate-binding protein